MPRLLSLLAALAFALGAAGGTVTCSNCHDGHYLVKGNAQEDITRVKQIGNARLPAEPEFRACYRCHGTTTGAGSLNVEQYSRQSNPSFHPRTQGPLLRHPRQRPAPHQGPLRRAAGGDPRRPRSHQHPLPPPGHRDPGDAPARQPGLGHRGAAAEADPRPLPGHALVPGPGGPPRAGAPGRPRRRPATGLGLAIVRQVADTDGLGIRVESEPGVGTRFTVQFPASAPDPVPEGKEDRRGLSPDRG